MGLAHSPRIVIDGLVLALDAGNTKSYSGSGTAWTDTVGGNHGTLTNGPTFSSLNGGSIVFDGTNDYVQVSASSDLNFGTGNFTIEGWFNKGATTTYLTLLGSDRVYSPSHNGTWILRISSATQIGFATYDGKGNIESAEFSASTLVDTWHHFALVREGTGTNQTKFYLDGVLKGSMTVSKSLTDAGTNGLRIGEEGDPGRGNDPFNGKISNVKLYKGKGLTAAEVAQNYSVLKERYVTPTIVKDGLILHLDAADTNSYSGSGNTWTDLSGEGNNATRTSSSEVVYDSSGWFDWTDGPASDSTQGCFTLPGNSFTLGANFTIEVWNYYDASSTPNSGSGVSPWSDGCLWTNSADADWNSGAGNNNGFLFGYNSFTYRNTLGQQVNYDYTTNPSTQTWHQHVLVVNSGAATVYVDKISVASLSNFRTIGQSNGTLGIGIADRYGSYRGEYNGYISNVKIYSRTLSTPEIQQNYNALKGRYE